MAWEMVKCRANGRDDVVRVTIAKSGVVSFSRGATQELGLKYGDYVKYYIDKEKKRIAFKVTPKDAFTRKLNWDKTKSMARGKITTIFKLLEIELQHSTIFAPYKTKDGFIVIYENETKKGDE